MIYIFIILFLLFIVFGFLSLRKYLKRKYSDKINAIYNQMNDYRKYINGGSNDKED